MENKNEDDILAEIIGMILMLLIAIGIITMAMG